jgi:hypothetical protein
MMVQGPFLNRSRSLPVVAAWLALSALGPPAAAQSCDDTTLATALSLGLSPVQIHAGDVNGDGRIDLISVENDPNIFDADPNGRIQVALGNGDGTFQLPPLSLPGPPTPAASVIGMWDSDGLVDLAVASGTAVTSFLGNATLGFGPANGPYAVGMTVTSLAGADFNGDGRADALVAGTTADVYVMAGNGDGTFTPPAVATTLGVADVVRVGDLDGDLDPDLALLRRVSSDVLVALNDGTGAFPVTRPLVTFPAAAHDLVVDDFDRDGRLDLAVISKSPNKALYLRLGTGNGFFEATPRQTSLVTNNPEFMVVGNFNGDAYPDLSVTQQGSIDFEILLGAGDGTFVTVLTRALGGGSPTSETTADINGDGLDDFIVAFEGQDWLVINTTGNACVSYATATSSGGPASGQNVLQWLSAIAPGVTGVRIRYNTSATPAGCVPPADAASGASLADLAFAPGRQTYTHGGLTPGTYYCYSVFALGGAGYSPPRSVTARPFDSTGLVKWGFSTGDTAALAPPGNGIGAVHVVANNAVVHALEKGAGGGTWPGGLPEWKPRQLPGPSQGAPRRWACPWAPRRRCCSWGHRTGTSTRSTHRRGSRSGARPPSRRWCRPLRPACSWPWAGATTTSWSAPATLACRTRSTPSASPTGRRRGRSTAGDTGSVPSTARRPWTTPAAMCTSRASPTEPRLPTTTRCGASTSTPARDVGRSRSATSWAARSSARRGPARRAAASTSTPGTAGPRPASSTPSTRTPATRCGRPFRPGPTDR